MVACSFWLLPAAAAAIERSCSRPSSWRQRSTDCYQLLLLLLLLSAAAAAQAAGDSGRLTASEARLGAAGAALATRRADSARARVALRRLVQAVERALFLLLGVGAPAVPAPEMERREHASDRNRL